MGHFLSRFVLKTQTSPSPPTLTGLQRLWRSCWHQWLPVDRCSLVCSWLPAFKSRVWVPCPPAGRTRPRLTFKPSCWCFCQEGKLTTDEVFSPSRFLVAFLRHSFTLWSEKYQKTVISCVDIEGKPHLSFSVFVFSDFCLIKFLGEAFPERFWLLLREAGLCFCVGASALSAGRC